MGAATRVDGASRPSWTDDLRLLVPPGVRQQLGIDDSAVVSLALDASRVMLWSSRALDDLLEVGA